MATKKASSAKPAAKTSRARKTDAGPDKPKAKSKSERAIKTAPATASKATVRKKRAAGKTSGKLPARFTLEPKSAVAEPVISHDDISLRAYFIAERRQQMGWAGDSATDWADAEAQLRAEALEKPLKKR